MLENYKNCTFCKSKKLIKLKNIKSENSFYVDAIISDLGITKKEINKIKVYMCENCKIKQHHPWFTKTISRKIYSSIYGQHNRSWNNLLSFIEKGKFPDHGNLFDILKSKIKIKKYAEYNSPFMGLFLNFFAIEYKKNIFSYKKIHSNIIKYLNCRQLAGKSKLMREKANSISKNCISQINKIKKKNKIKKSVKKYLIIDNSSLGWGQNDNYKSVNSKSYAQELFDLDLLDSDTKLKKYNFDLFGIFHSLDHTFEPSKILNFALNSSKYVIVFCHYQLNGITKQHQFSITKDFLKYLSQNKIYNIDISELINKEFKSSEIYFLCTKSKKNLNEIKNKFL